VKFSVLADQVDLHDLKAKHNSANIAISGTGKLGAGAFVGHKKFFADQLPVDDALMHALAPNRLRLYFAG